MPYITFHKKTLGVFFIVLLSCLLLNAYSSTLNAQEGVAPSEREDLVFIKNLFNDKIYNFARQEAEIFEKNYPNSSLIPEIVFIQAQIDVVEESLEPALKKYARIINQYPTSSFVEDALYYSGALKIQLNRVEGLKDFDQLTGKFNNSKYLPRIDFHRGVQAFKQEQWAKAEPYFKRVLKSEGLTEEHRFQNQHYLAWIYYFQGKTILAKSLFFELLESKIPQADKAKISFQLGIDAQKQENYQKAISWYERQMSEWPHPDYQDRSRFWIAECYYLEFKKQPETSTSAHKEKSIRLYSENLNLEKPVSPDISRYHRGWLLIAQDRKKEAEEDFALLQANNPIYGADLELTATRATFFEEKNDLTAANKVYAEALNYQKESVIRNMLLLNLIRNSHSLKDCASILNWAGKADLSEENKDTPEISFYSGRCHFADNRWKQAGEYFSRIPLTTQYGRVVFLNYLYVYQQLQDFEGGMTYLDRVESHPEFGNKEKILLMKMEFAQSLKQWAKTLEIMLTIEKQVPDKAKDPWFLLNIAKTADSVYSALDDEKHPMHRYPVNKKSYYGDLALQYYQSAYNLIPSQDSETKLSLLDLLVSRYSSRSDYRKVVAFYHDAIKLVSSQEQKDKLRLLMAKLLVKELQAQQDAQRELLQIHNKGNTAIHFEASSLLAELYVEQKKLIQAIKILEDLSKQPIENTEWYPLVHFRLGEMYQAKERWQKAVFHYDLVVKSKLESPLKTQAKSRAATIEKYLKQQAQSQTD
ncbi:hypothetical protein KJ966_13365 [bacterium]|nr:hypothetical protein [bacterium]